MASEHRSRGRETAVGQVYSLAERLIANFPEIAQVYQTDPTITQRDLAERFLPEEFEISARVTEAAIHTALKHLLGTAELTLLAEQRQVAERQRRAESGFYHTDAFRAQTQKASAARHAHSTDEERRRIAEMLAEAQGDAIWTDDEAAYLCALLQMPDFYFVHGKLVPDYTYIADALNAQFNTDRSMIAVRSKVYRLKAIDPTILLEN